MCMSSKPDHADAEGSRIAQVSERLGVPVPTIRSWERRYGFPVPARTGGQHRRYSDVEIGQLRLLRDLITTGYSAREAADRLLAGVATNVGPEEVDEFVDAARHLDPRGIRRALDAAAARLGIDLAVRDVLLPAMEMLGSAWKTGTCDIEHEHLATDSARGWIGLQASLTPPPSRRALVVLACGPQDLHTIGLEGFALILARRGWPCRMLGALTPSETLRAATVASTASAVVVTAQRSVTRRAAVESLAGVAWLPGVSAFYAGKGFAAPASRANVPGIYLGTDLVAAVDIVGSTLRLERPAKARERSRTVAFPS